MKKKKNYGKCEECDQENTGPNWCRLCNAKRFQQNFKNWTSGNDNIDKFIQDTQLLSDNHYKVLEWIPYNRFYDIIYLAKGGFGNVYKANWIDGHIHNWDNKNKFWERRNQDKFMALKSLYNSKDITLEFINEITSHHKVDNACIIGFYGITQNPESKDYMMVLDYAKNGNLRNYLDKSYKKLSWENKFLNLWVIADGLNTIHKKDLIHRDLHPGNILINHKNKPRITDMGLCKPADHNGKIDCIYGVVPYMAPEILRNQDYTKSVDIYSFGIIMYEVISGLPLYRDRSHNTNLMIEICGGLRPRFNIKVPQLIVDLIKKCLDGNPLNRPTADELQKTLWKWWQELENYQTNQNNQRSTTLIIEQTKEADEINKNLSTSSLPSTSLGLSYETHPEAIYISRLLNFDNDLHLLEPKNSGGQHNNNMISKEFSESLQIDILNFH